MASEDQVVVFSKKVRAPDSTSYVPGDTTCLLYTTVCESRSRQWHYAPLSIAQLYLNGDLEEIEPRLISPCLHILREHGSSPRFETCEQLSACTLSGRDLVLLQTGNGILLHATIGWRIVSLLMWR